MKNMETRETGENRRDRDIGEKRKPGNHMKNNTGKLGKPGKPWNQEKQRKEGERN